MDQPGQQQYFLPEGFITATGRPEPISRLVGTVQVIHQDRIAKSTARSVTELLNENAVGFMSEWTPGQTSINIRGAATEGQGRDFKSQVLVLINGHRAGTANISKLSTADIERIEIVRGPSSVIYGSQNMGGVISIILKTGLTAPGNVVQADAGSWNLLEGKAASGGLYKGFDWYVGGAASTARQLRHLGRRAGAQHGVDAIAPPAPSAIQIDEEQPRRGHGALGRHLQCRLPRLERQPVRLRHALQLSRSTRATLPRRATGRATPTSRPTSSPTLTILNNPSPLSALNAPAARTHDGPQPPPARHPRHALPASLQAFLRQRASVRPGLGAQLAALRSLSRRRLGVTERLAAGQQPD